MEQRQNKLPYATNAADVVVISSCGWSRLTNAIYFDLVIPSSPDEPKSQLQKQVDLIKNLEALGQNGEQSRFSGALRLEVGSPDKGSNNAAGSSFTVIIQNGENTNNAK